MSVTTGTFPGVRIVDMPNLGTVTDNSSFVGEHAGSGRFAATALRGYIMNGLSWINVRDYGALGNGAADDTSAIQAAINAAAAGGIVLFPTGTYNVSSTINVADGVSLIGECGNAAFPEVDSIAVSRLLWIGASGGTLLSIAVPGWGGGMEAIVLDGNAGLAGVCLRVNSINGGVFKKVTCQFGGTGLLMNATLGQNCVLNTFYSCFFHDCVFAVLLDGTNGTTGTVTLNSFFGCRISGSEISLILRQWADTNFFYGGRIEVGYDNVKSHAISINPAGYATGVNAVTFMGVSVDGVFGYGAAVMAVEPWPASPYGPIATFYSCYFVGGQGFNTGPGVVKCIECTNLGYYYGNGSQSLRQVAQQIAVGASPFTYANPGPFALEMIVGAVPGSTMTLVQTTRGSETVTLGVGPNFTITIQPGDSLAITYTAAAPLVIAQPE